MIICSDNNCFGCALCYEICPQKAIKIEDCNGFYRPVIDEDKCVNCGLCKKTCPGLKMMQEGISEDYQPKKCFAAVNSNNKIRQRASSGGVARLLAEMQIKSGGFVVGVIFNQAYCRAEFKVFYTLEDLQMMSNSMYVQTYKGNVYKEIRKASRDKDGLFIGVPCDIYAFKTYFNLILKGNSHKAYYIDLLCHGGSSSKCFKEHISAIKQNKEITNVSFRGGDYDCCLTVFNGKKVVYQGEQLKDPYFKCFMRHSLYQRACFECPFAGKTRIGDLTLGDFWDLDGETEEKLGGMKKGISLLCVNSLEGKELLKDIEPFLKIEERPYIEAMNGNSTLKCPTEKPSEYEMFWHDIENKGFIYAVENIYEENYLESCVNWESAFKERKRNALLLKIKETFPMLYLVFKKLK